MVTLLTLIISTIFSRYAQRPDRNGLGVWRSRGSSSATGVLCTDRQAGLLNRYSAATSNVGSKKKKRFIECTPSLSLSEECWASYRPQPVRAQDRVAAHLGASRLSGDRRRPEATSGIQRACHRTR